MGTWLFIILHISEFNKIKINIINYNKYYNKKTVISNKHNLLLNENNNF